MKLLEMFQEAEKKGSRLVIEYTFIQQEGKDQHKHRIRFHLAAKRKLPDFPNYLYMELWAGNNMLKYLGKITKKGEVYFSPQATQKHKELIELVYTNPAEAIAKMGRETGICGFCSRALTNPESIKLGYGPVCAERYGLPHSENLA
jgi:hypothetical protein